MPHTLLVPISRPTRGMGGGEHRCRDGVANRGQSSTTTRPGSMAHVAALILDDVRTLDAQPLHVSMPRDKRSGQTSPAPAVAHWRGCLPARQGSALSTGGIIADALVRLARGQDVASVSRGIGYASASVFAAMFRKALGQTRAIISLIEAVCSRHGSLRDIASLGT